MSTQFFLSNLINFKVEIQETDQHTVVQVSEAEGNLNVQAVLFY